MQDESGSAVPGVTVRIVNEDTGVTADAVSNERGIYRVTALVPGRYRVEGQLDGFEPFVKPSLTLRSARRSPST